MNSEKSEPKSDKSFEIRCGVTIALFAALLAITDLFGGKYGDDEIKAINERSAAYQWYQSKSIKETILEGQLGLLQSLQRAGAIAAVHEKGVSQHLIELEKDIRRYGKEKKEILLGSQKVGSENWIQDVDGKLGQVKGAQEFDAEVMQLAKAGDRLDLATLFLQISLVMGAISLVLANPRTQNLFYSLMAGLGLVGSVFMALGLML